MPASLLRRPRRKEADKLDAAVAAALAALLAYRPDFSAYTDDVEAELERVYLAAYAHAAPDATLSATVREQAASFAQERAATLADDLAQTTADGIDALAIQARRSGMSLSELVDALDGSFVFSAGRASMIAVTEIAIASALGHRQAAEDQGQTRKRWVSRGDELVCFPAGTMIATPDGQTAIESLAAERMVLTPRGPRRVVSVSERQYTGVMVRIRHARGDLVATVNHRVLTLEQGWLEAGGIEVGYHLQSIGNEVWEVRRVDHFCVGQADHTPTSLAQEVRLPLVLHRVLMPVQSIDFEGDGYIAQQEVNCVSTDLRFLCEADTEFLQRVAHECLGASLASVDLEAGQRTETCAAGDARLDAEGRGARKASDDLGRTAALHGAILTEVGAGSSVGVEPLTATGAVAVTNQRTLARESACHVSAGHRSVHRERSVAYWAHLLDLCAARFITASRRAETPPASLAVGRIRHAEADATVGADVFLRVHPRSSVVADRRAKLERIAGARAAMPLECASAVLTDEAEWHQSQYITVYNLTVEEEHVYFADGVLVHNCDDCSENEDADWLDIDTPFPSGDDDTPAHPNCRCTVDYEDAATEQDTEQDAAPAPVVKEARCPQCRHLEARNVNHGAELNCRKCRQGFTA